MNKDKHARPGASSGASQDASKRKDKAVEDEEEMPSGLRPDLEPASKDNEGRGGDGGGVGNSI